MQLGQAKAIGVFDDKGVGVGNVHAGFDDGGTHQNIDFVLQQLPPDIGQLIFGHFAVGEAHPCLG